MIHYAASHDANGAGMVCAKAPGIIFRCFLYVFTYLRFVSTGKLIVAAFPTQTQSRTFISQNVLHTNRATFYLTDFSSFSLEMTNRHCCLWGEG